MKILLILILISLTQISIEISETICPKDKFKILIGCGYNNQIIFILNVKLKKDK